MPETLIQAYDLRHLRNEVLSERELALHLSEATALLNRSKHVKSSLSTGLAKFAAAVGSEVLPIQVAWESTVECQRYSAGTKPTVDPDWWTTVRAVTATRLVTPPWRIAAKLSPSHLFNLLPDSDPLFAQHEKLVEGMGRLPRISRYSERAPNSVLKIMIHHGYDTFDEISEDDLRSIDYSRQALALDNVDSLLCSLGVFERTSLRGSSKATRSAQQPTISELMAKRECPDRFRQITIDYLEEAKKRHNYTFSTLKQRSHSLTRFWRFIGDEYPDVLSAAEVTPEHGRAYMDAMIDRSRVVRKGLDADSDEDDRLTVYSTVGDVRVMFHDLTAWATEAGSHFEGRAPSAAPFRNREIIAVGFRGARQKQEAKMQRIVLDLERELPAVRAYAMSSWSEAREAAVEEPRNHKLNRRELRHFWRWALLELFIQTGMRIEEALELTALDLLRRRLPDGRQYYLLNIKPSKHGRARLLPVGDDLGRLLAEIVRHVKKFYDSDLVPAIDAWDFHENELRPRAPYLLQGNGFPRALAPTSVREMLSEVSVAAGATRADGSALYFRPHDGRRVFASEHLNHNTPVHVIAALLGHAGLDTVMVYAKLYPKTLVDEYRKAVRGTFITMAGPEGLRNPTEAEWAEFEQSCGLRDMGTHICALPTGDHCERGLVCLGCNHAQPKKSAEPLFARMLISHKKELSRAESRGEPPGQIAARSLEVHRIENALTRTRALPVDVATAIEATV